MLVSILIPVFNCEAFLRQCLDSVVGQTWRDLQVVVVDDGSTDGSWDIMREYAARDSRVEVYHQENAGVGTARNRLLDLARGDFVLFVDSDDWIELNTIETLMREQAAANYDMVTYEAIGSNNEVDAVYNQEQVIEQFLAHVTFNGSLCFKLVRRMLFEGHHFDPLISYGEDALMTWHVLQCVKSVRVTPFRFYHYRMNDTSISHQSYGSKRKSGHQVWKQIAEETEHNWPRYRHIAIATFAISDMWQLYFAAKSNYPFDEDLKHYQANVKKHVFDIVKSGLVSANKIFFAIAVSISYTICRLMLMRK